MPLLPTLPQMRVLLSYQFSHELCNWNVDYRIQNIDSIQNYHLNKVCVW